MQTCRGTAADRIEFEYAWLAFGMLIGLGYLITSPSAAVQAVLPPWFAYIWAAMFLLGGGVGATGVDMSFNPDRRLRYWGLTAERAGHGLQVAAVSTLGVAALYAWERAGGPFPVISLSLVATWMAVVPRRIVRVTQIIKGMVALGESEALDGGRRGKLGDRPRWRIIPWPGRVRRPRSDPGLVQQGQGVGRRGQDQGRGGDSAVPGDHRGDGQSHGQL